MRRFDLFRLAGGFFLLDVVEHKEFDEEVNEVVDEDEAKTVAMEV